MFEGDMVAGELEIGQISGLIHSVIPAAEIVEEIVRDFERTKARLSNLEL
jgi:enoyl-[acyl-carrier protein] reductase II